MPGQAPEALTRSSGITCFSGVSGGASIEMLRVNIRPGLGHMDAMTPEVLQSCLDFLSRR